MWVQSMRSRTYLGSLTYDELEDNFKAIFDHLNHTGPATDQLFVICQGAHSVAEYAVDFWTMTVNVCWNEPALQGGFRRGLNGPVWDALVLRP